MIHIHNLKTYIQTNNGIVKAVDGISFQVDFGETVCIVGESGSGKSVLAHSIMQLNEKTKTFHPEGAIYFEEENLLKATDKRLRQIRGNEIAMIFQDPMSSLNPVFKIGRQLIEAITSHEKISKKDARKKAIELLKDVGIPDAETRLNNYPHQFSGGMRQRVLIAIALAGRPKLLIADEPTTALDVTIQAQILELIQKIQKKYDMAVLLITHDLGVVAQIADRVLVMYSGQIVEQGSVEDIFYRSGMPYTWSLLQSLPRIDGDTSEKLIPIQGQPASLLNPPKGCRFQERCPFAKETCRIVDPELTKRGEGHWAACLLSEKEFYEARENRQLTKGVSR